MSRFTGCRAIGCRESLQLQLQLPLSCLCLCLCFAFALPLSLLCPCLCFAVVLAFAAVVAFLVVIPEGDLRLLLTCLCSCLSCCNPEGSCFCRCFCLCSCLSSCHRRRGERQTSVSCLSSLEGICFYLLSLQSFSSKTAQKSLVKSPGCSKSR
jgi:hypothetical protein